mgnify:CR=1 FL=1
MEEVIVTLVLMALVLAWFVYVIVGFRVTNLERRLDSMIETINRYRQEDLKRAQERREIDRERVSEKFDRLEARLK